LVNTEEQEQTLFVRIMSVDTPTTDVSQAVQVNSAAPTTVFVDKLVPGLYRLFIRPQTSTQRSPSPIHGVFEVVDPSGIA
jgi:hypothetical protein